MQLYILRFFYWLATHLSLANVERIATLLGDLTWLFHSRVRRDLEANLHQVMPHATERQLARASRQALRTLCRIYADELRTPSIPKSEFLAALDVHGREHLDQSLQDGKGAILTTAHFGAPQIVAQILALWDYPTMTVVEHTQPEAIFQFMWKLRAKRGLRLIASDSSMLPLIRILRRENGVVALAVDRDVTKSGIEVPFFDRAARMPDGAVRLALSTDAPIHIAYCRRKVNGEYEAWIEPALSLPPSDAPLEERVRHGMATVLERIERFIRAEPSQWVATVPVWNSEQPQLPR